MVLYIGDTTKRIVVAGSASSEGMNGDFGWKPVTTGEAATMWKKAARLRTAITQSDADSKFGGMSWLAGDLPQEPHHGTAVPKATELGEHVSNAGTVKYEPNNSKSTKETVSWLSQV